MIINIIIYAFIAVFNLVLAFIVFRKDKKSLVNQTFALFVFLLGTWSLCIIFQQTIANVFWGIITIFFGLSMGAIFPLFTRVYPTTNKKSNLIFYLPFVIPLFIFLALVGYDSSLILKEVKEYAEPVFGPAYPFMIPYAIFIIIYGFVMLILRYRKIYGIEKAKMKYLFAGLFLFFTTIIVTNVILPVFKVNQLIIFGPLTSLFFVGFTSYAIIRHRLMDIRLVIKRSLVTFFSFLFVILFVWGIMVGIGELIGRKPDPKLTIAGLFSVVLAIIIYSFIKKLFDRLANKYFFTSLYNYQKTLENLAQELTYSIELEQIIDSIVKTIRDAMKLDRTGVLLFNEQSSNYQVQQTIGFTEANGISLVRNNFLTNHLLKTRKPVIYQELESLQNNGNGEKSEISKLKANMKRIEASLCLSLIIKNNLIGIIVLGNKITKDAYTTEDLRLLESIGNQASIAIENARLYNNMEEIVDSQTKDIRAKTRHLEKLLQMRSEFLDITSHQLRTPTSVLIGILEMAVSGELDALSKEMKQRQLKGAYLKARKLEQIVSDLLRASELDSVPFQIKSKDFEKIKLEEFLNQIIASHVFEAEKQGVTVSLKKPLPFSKIFGEKIFLEEAIGNLIDNAIKYTPEKNEKTGEKGKITISCEKDKNYAYIKVKDNGIGIPKEEMPKLFDKFSRASNAKEMYTDGTGLGLFIVREIIKGHGGKVAVESKLGYGSTFTVALPLKPPTK